jgi:hypothetical protein
MELFMSFMSAVLSSMQGQQVQSPQEIRKRAIMTQTFNTLVQMLNGLQDSIGAQSQNLIFYGNLQQNYSKEMTRVPTYVGSPNDNVQAPGTLSNQTDWTKFTFGYNNISVADIANWWAYNSLLPGATPQTFSMASYGKSGNTPLFTITFTPQNGTTPGSISWTVNGSTTSVPIPAKNPLSSYTPTGAFSQLQNASTDYATAFETVFTSAWNGISAGLASINVANLAAINAVTPDQISPTFNTTVRSQNDTSSNSGMELPWMYGYVASGQAHSNDKGEITPAGNYSDQQAKTRAEVNALLQNDLENLRSHRQAVQNQAQTLQTDLDQARQSVTDQSDMLDATLQTVQDIMDSIFAHS